MSCIRFNTPAQRQAMRDHAPVMLTAEEAAALHPAPAVTASKIARLRTLANDPNPKIRETVASSYHAPEDLLEKLARDPDEGVRSWLARNETASCDILRSLADDESEKVRGWLALNFFVPGDVMERLADDPDDTVRALVRWKASLAEAAPADTQLTST
ncbi:MAG: HEAT repeat domain-containing protein [Microbacteriaceae bacterium]